MSSEITSIKNNVLLWLNNRMLLRFLCRRHGPQVVVQKVLCQERQAFEDYISSWPLHLSRLVVYY